MKQLVVALLSLSLASCVVIFRRVDVDPVSTRAPVAVATPVKAHLTDGSVVVYARGVAVTTDALVGEGAKFDLARTASGNVTRVPLADVIGMESFSTQVNAGTSVLVSTLGTIVGAMATAALAVAIFGSCPTVYSSDGTVEEAELFSSSIAPLFEGRDLDRLQARADQAGVVRLDVRNEAMETHYINHLEVLEVEHRPDERVVPDIEGLPIVVGASQPAARAVSRDGADVGPLLAAADDRFYLTTRPRLDAATAADMDDWIDLAMPVPPGATSAVLVFRMRNSLLNTILLYDVMLGPSGAAALDWLGDGLGRISTAVALGDWHRRRSGLHVSVWRDGAYAEVARVADSGPISWHDVAAEIPVPRGESQLRVRLSSLADHWRVDQVGVSFAARHPEARTIPLASVRGPHGADHAAALVDMRDSDDRYLQTNPGERMTVSFDAGRDLPGRTRTFLLAAQGYYVEWIRGSWIRNATRTEPFLPSDDAVLDAMRRWGTERDTFERRFLQARVPTS